MLSNQKSKFYLLIARLDFQCLLPVNRQKHVVSMFNVILGFFKINLVNGLAFVCLSFHFMMLGSSYELSNYQFAES